MSDPTNPSPPSPPSSPAPAPASTAFMTCSECRAPMRDRYYALNERPICAKCRPAYARKIERTDGRGAMLRVGIQGTLVAIIGAGVLAAVVTVFPPARIFPLVPIGFLIGKRMMSMLEGYSARRYQYLAVTLTYACFFAGLYLPTARERRESVERRAAVQVKMQGTAATQDAQITEELASFTPASAPDSADEEFADSTESGDAVPAAPPPSDERIGPGPGLAFVLLMLMPLFAMLQFGTAFSAVGVLSLGYALFQAWKQTDGQGTHLQLSGPFRVGSGPIPAR